MKLIITGPPGSGKGTVSEKLIKDFNLFHFSPGELLREEVSKNTTIGRDIKQYMERGDLVPDKFVVEMVKLEIKDKEDYILDGFPRSVGQAKEIDDFGIDAVIYLDVPEEVAVERLSLRRLCLRCGSGYHLKYIPPRKKGLCDKCGTKLTQRKDDRPKAIKERFKVYRQKTQPVIDYFKKRGILKIVDGTPEPKKVYIEVKKIVRSL